MPVDRRPSRAVLLTLGVICALALGLRLYALGYGLPAVYNPDEIPILNRALAFGTGDLNPHNFLYPTLYFYALFVWEGLFFIVGWLAGWFASLAAFQRAFFVDPSHFVLAGRALTAVFGTLTVPALYLFGARLYGRTTALVAALFLAVAPFAVRDAHYIKHDVPVTLFVVLTLWALARIVVDPEVAARPRSWVLAGALSGLAMSTHYYAIVVVVPFFAVAIADARRAGGWQASLRLLVWAGAASVVAFFVASPFLLVEPQTAIRDMVAVRQIDLDRAVVGAGPFVSLGRYLQMLETDAIGWTVGLAAVAGFIAALVGDWRRGLLLVSFPLAFLAFLANTVPMNRYVNAMLPSVALAAAFALTRVMAGRSRPLLTGLLGAAMAVPGLLGSVQSDRFFNQDDTRTLAERYIERTIPAGASVLIQPYSVPLRPSRASLVEALRANLGSEARASIKYQLELALDPWPAPAYRTIYLGDGGTDADKIYVSRHAFDGGGGLGVLRAQRVEYVVLKRYNTPNLALSPLRAALRREGRLIATFSPYRADVSPTRQAAVAPFLHNTDARIDPALERPGPTIELWRIND
jgi:Dolichyl-phosphate-mannose-protein mannosyltransferase